MARLGHLAVVQRFGQRRTHCFGIPGVRQHQVIFRAPELDGHRDGRERLLGEGEPERWRHHYGRAHTCVTARLDHCGRHGRHFGWPAGNYLACPVTRVSLAMRGNTPQISGTPHHS